MNEQIADLLAQIHEEQAQYDYTIREGAKPEDIVALVDDAKRQLAATLPEAYLEFLRLSDGLNFDSLFIYDTGSTPDRRTGKNFWQGFVFANAQWRENPENKSYLFFGASDLDLYGLDLRSGRFRQMDKMSYDLGEVYSSFDDMLTAMLQECLEN